MVKWASRSHWFVNVVPAICRSRRPALARLRQRPISRSGGGRPWLRVGRGHVVDRRSSSVGSLAPEWTSPFFRRWGADEGSTEVGERFAGTAFWRGEHHRGPNRDPLNGFVVFWNLCVDRVLEHL